VKNDGDDAQRESNGKRDENVQWSAAGANDEEESRLQVGL
jgi:hypothetical protein